jgi:cell shape-determining protein MreC
MRRFAASLVVWTFVTFSVGTSAQTASANPSAPAEAAADAPAKMSPQQAQILADTEKLRKLSQELKAEVDKSSKETLSLAVIKKAQEVEKLAKTLKEEMSKSH